MLIDRKHTLSPQVLARALCFWASVLVLLTSCATSPPLTPVAGPGALKAAAGSGWWAVEVHFSWPTDTRPAMHLDLLVAREIFGPLIDAHRDTLPLWRFHRRAARDAAGHRLRFLFYALPSTATEINATLTAHPLLGELHSAGVIDSVVIDDPEGEPQTDLAATSDPAWSSAMQSAWPYFIMGVSQMWLSLMDQIAAGEIPRPSPGDPDALILFYKGLGDRMTTTWQKEGRHALLHHLNALFGYERLPISLRF